MSDETVAEMQPLRWLIRRELWENRFLVFAPLIVTAIVLFSSLVTVVTMIANGRLPVKPFSIAPAPIMFCALIVGFFYSLDALYGERRDRSILFWKSLPISDRVTVLSKASIPIVVLPLFAYALSVMTQIVMLMLSTPVMLANGMNPATLVARLDFFQGLIIMIYGLTVHALWFAPIYAWFMLISAWARRAPFLWAVLPVLAIGAVERIVFNSWLFMSVLKYRLGGAMREAFVSSKTGDFEKLSQLTPLRFLSAPGLWVGLAFAALCFGAAVRLRRHREPI